MTKVCAESVGLLKLLRKRKIWFAQNSGIEYEYEIKKDIKISDLRSKIYN